MRVEKLVFANTNACTVERLKVVFEDVLEDDVRMDHPTIIKDNIDGRKCSRDERQDCRTGRIDGEYRVRFP